MVQHGLADSDAKRVIANDGMAHPLMAETRMFNVEVGQ